jgi:uncharacterized protein involved in outer membrane biogenesis
LGNAVHKKINKKKVVLRIVLLLALLLVGTFTWLINDTQFVKQLIEKQLTNLTHRSFKINGDFDFKLGRDLQVTAGGIQWASASWGKQSDMLKIDKAFIVVDFWSLIKHPVILRNVSVENAMLDFDWDEEKRSNWYLGDRTKTPDPAKKRLESLPLLVDKIDIQNLDLQFRHPELTDDLIIKVVQAQHQANTNDDLVVDIEGQAKGHPISLVGSIGPFPKLIVAGAVAFDLTAKSEKSSLSMKGQTPRLSKWDFTTLQAGFKSTEVSNLIAVLNLPLVTHGPADLDINYQSNQDGADGKALGNVGEFDLDVVMHVADLQNWQGLVVDAKSKGPSASAAGKLLGITFLPAEPYQLDVEIHDSGKGLLIDAAHFSTAGAVISAAGSVKGFPEFTGIQLDFDADAKSIVPFMASLADHNVPDLSLNVKGTIDQKKAGSNDQLVLDIKLGEMHANLNGNLSEKKDFSGSAFQYTLNIPDSLILKELFKGPVRRSVPITFEGGLMIRDGGPFLTETSAQIGENELSLSSDIPLREIKHRFSSAIELSGPNAASAVELFSEFNHLPASAFQVSGSLGFTGPKVTFSPLQGHLGDNQFKINGSLDFGQTHPLSNFEFSAEGPDLNAVVSSFALEGVPSVNFSTTGLLQMTEQSVDLSGLVIHIGNNQIKGSISSGWPNQPESFSFDISGSGQNLQEVLSFIPDYTPAKVPFSVEARGKAEQKIMVIETAKARIGGASFDIAGEVGMAPQWSANQVRLTGSGDNLADLGVVHGWQFLDSNFNLSATMSGQENELSISDLLLKVGPNDLQGTLHIVMAEKPGLDVDLVSTYLDLTTLQEKIDQQQDGVTVAAKPKDADERLISAQNIPFDKLNGLDGSFKIDIDRFVSSKLDLRNAQMQATLKDGLFNVPSFSALSASATGRAGSGGLNGKLQIQAHPERSKVDVWLNAKKLLIVNEAIDKYVSKNNPGQDIDLHLTGQGNNLRDLAASLNGYLWIRGGERQIEASALDVLYGDLLTQVFTTVLPFSKSSKYQTLVCDRVFFEAKNGMLETAPAILLRTDTVNIEAVGLINLATEEINFNIQSVPRTGLGVSTAGFVNSFFRFQGTLANPQLRIDPSGTLVEGGAALATAGLSMVAKSLYKRWLKKELTCEEVTEEARKIRVGINPVEVPPD